MRPNLVQTLRMPFASEKLLPKHPVHGFTGCRIATIYHGYALATNNVAVLNKQFKPEFRKGRRVRLQAGWDGTKDKDRDSYNQSHVPLIAGAMFKGLPKPSVHQGSFKDAWDRLDEGFAVSLAVHLPTVCDDDPNSPACRYTKAPHQILLVDRRFKEGVSEGLVVDPMAPIGDPTAKKLEAYHGHWVRRNVLRKAALAFPTAEGKAFYELFPIGGWTGKAVKQLAGG